MALSNTEHGKAFEFACLDSLKEYLRNNSSGPVMVVMSDAYLTAAKAFEKATQEGLATKLALAANAATRALIRLEPQLEHGNDALSLSIQSDSQGIAGDVRDIVCVRSSTGWEIGLSCKHNHYAVKHSRLSATIDFGKEWLNIPCSRTYFDKITPIFNELRTMRDIAIQNSEPLPLWKDIPNKAERFYVPVLTAFLEELQMLAYNNPEVPDRLIQYLIGRHDFYKVITDERRRTTRVEAVNINGRLSKSANGHHAIASTTKLKLPTRFFYIGFVPNSDNTIEIVCDEGWQLTMRIHNASSKVEPSLKFDVQLTSLPSSIYSQVEPW